METIKCTVGRIKYKNETNGYTVFNAFLTLRQSITIVAYYMEWPEGTEMECDGEWKMDKKYGKEFVASMCREIVPKTVDGIEAYIGSGIIRGIGPKLAREIVQIFGEETITVIENTPERLREVNGIGTKRIEVIVESWAKYKGIQDVMIFLQQYGISTLFARKIYKEYGANSIRRVRENPYCLADDIKGIGFASADVIARRMGYAVNDPRRLRSGINYYLREQHNNGHVFSYLKDILYGASNLLYVKPQCIQETVESMASKRELIIEGTAVYRSAMYNIEVSVGQSLRRIMTCPGPKIKPFGEKDIDRIEKILGIQYDETQKEAIIASQNEKITVLTGGPGTGKTRTTQGIIAAFVSSNMNIALAAPSGRAAKRMNEATGMEAMTIHRLLEFTPDGEFRRDASNPLECDVLILDECSMIDITLLYHLLNAVPSSTRLILVGDIDQLPSIGPGNCLKDIINSEVFPVIRLTHIFRQSQKSRIVTNAHMIREGIMPDISDIEDSDFQWIEGHDEKDIINTIVQTVSHDLVEEGGYKMEDIQILTPMKVKEIGVFNLNKILQDVLNPGEEGIGRNDYLFKVGDRVIQVKNNYKLEVFNGDIGYIYEINKEDKSLTVVFKDSMKQYVDDDIDDLALAYAITIHRAQGSEFPVVVMPVHSSHKFMLERNLVYTGLTRAKQKCVFIGEQDALEYAAQNKSSRYRNSFLKKRITG